MGRSPSRRFRRLTTCLVLSLALLLAGAGPGHVPAADPDINFPHTDGNVFALEIVGNLLLVGGKFTMIGGVARRNLAAIDLTTNTVTEWHPKPNREVWSIYPSPSGETVYVAGKFTKFRRVLRSRAAEVELAGRGDVTPFDPQIDGLRAQAVVTTGDKVFVGGKFDGAAGVAQPFLIAFDTAGAQLDWAPSLNDQVWDLEIGPDGYIWAAGRFNGVSGNFRRGIAGIHPDTAEVHSWAPLITIPALDIVFGDDGRLYASAAGSGGNILAYENPNVDRQLLWRVQVNGDMQAIDIDGDIVYAGGHPSAIYGGTPAVSKTFALDADTGTILDWDGQNTGGKGAWEIVVGQQGVFMGGQFRKIEGNELRGLGMFPF